MFYRINVSIFQETSLLETKCTVCNLSFYFSLKMYISQLQNMMIFKDVITIFYELKLLPDYNINVHSFQYFIWNASKIPISLNFRLFLVGGFVALPIRSALPKDVVLSTLPKFAKASKRLKIWRGIKRYLFTFDNTLGNVNVFSA